MKLKSHLLALRLIQNAQDYLQALINAAQLASLQQEVWEDALAEGVGDDLVGLFCPPKVEVSAAHPGSTLLGYIETLPSPELERWADVAERIKEKVTRALILPQSYTEGEFPVFTPPTDKTPKE